MFNAAWHDTEAYERNNRALKKSPLLWLYGAGSLAAGFAAFDASDFLSDFLLLGSLVGGAVTGATMYGAIFFDIFVFRDPTPRQAPPEPAPSPGIAVPLPTIEPAPPRTGLGSLVGAGIGAAIGAGVAHFAKLPYGLPWPDIYTGAMAGLAGDLVEGRYRR